MKSVLTLLSFAFFLLAAWFVIGLESWIGISSSLFSQALLVGFGIGMALVLILSGAHRALLLALSAYVLLIISFNFVDFSPVQPALRVVRDIRVGMSENEARAVVNRHFPEHGRFKRPQLESFGVGGLAFAIDPDDGRYNAAIVEIRFAQGNVAFTRFLAD